MQNQSDNCVKAFYLEIGFYWFLLCTDIAKQNIYVHLKYKNFPMLLIYLQQLLY